MNSSNRIIVPKGTKFAEWTVLNSADFTESKYGKNKALWLVKCSCGNTKKILANNILRGLSKSCGCTKKKTKESTLKNYYLSYKKDSNRRGRAYKFSLSFEEFKKLIKRPCYYCKAEPETRKFHYSGLKLEVNGIDRINNTKGYTLENCVPCCKTCNRMKSDLSHSVFMEKINAISNRSCGDDYNTRTTYVTEANVGDTAKVLLLCIYDLSEKFNLQKSEITALFQDLLNQHIIEIDELEEK